jgi:Retrotransposon gag protein
MDPTILPQAALQPTVTISRLKIKDPDVWSGKRSTLPGFLTSCRVKFMIEEHNFTKEIYKIGYAGSFLGGTPATWWCTLFQRYEKAVDNPPIELTSFTEFSRALTTSFGDPDLTGTMERELRTLRQTTSVADYAAEFQRIAGFLIADWGDRPLLSTYRNNLKDNIKDALVHEKPFPTTLLEMIAASIRIDNREYERILDQKVAVDRKVAVD